MLLCWLLKILKQNFIDDHSFSCLLDMFGFANTRNLSLCSWWLPTLCKGWLNFLFQESRLGVKIFHTSNGWIQQVPMLYNINRCLALQPSNQSFHTSYQSIDESTYSSLALYSIMFSDDGNRTQHVSKRVKGHLVHCYSQKTVAWLY